MPLPTPNTGESRSEFMTRCMDSETMKDEYPEPEQRSAVCRSQRERRDNAQARAGWICRALTYPIVTGMIVMSATACTAIEQKGEAYQEAAARFLYPDKIKVCYSREGDDQSGIEYRCFGEGCELPPCPGGDNP